MERKGNDQYKVVMSAILDDHSIPLRDNYAPASRQSDGANLRDRVTDRSVCSILPAMNLAAATYYFGFFGYPMPLAEVGVQLI